MEQGPYHHLRRPSLCTLPPGLPRPLNLCTAALLPEMLPIPPSFEGQLRRHHFGKSPVFSTDWTNWLSSSEQPVAPGLGAYSSPQRGETQRDTEVLCSALPPVAVGPLAPQAPGHPPEANLEFPGQKEEPPSSLEAGGSGFPGILLHNGPAVSRKARWDGH